MSEIIVYSGPSLPGSTIRRWLPEAEIREPARCGDMCRAAAEGVVAIGLIDGCSGREPTVGCQEVLWAIKQGIYVYGAAALGALRAAELDRLGMIGVGRIFQLYRDGKLEADDEVLVTHGDAEQRYRNTSVALVNVRATLEKAVARWVISEAEANALIKVGRAMFYPQRTYPDLFEAARRQNVLTPDAISRLTAWVDSSSECQVDQKRIDAEAMIRRMASTQHDGRCAPPAYAFQHTEVWDAVTRWVAKEDQARAAR